MPSHPVRIDWRELLSTRRNPATLTTAIISTLPTLLILYLDIDLSFTPRGLDYSRELAPLFLAPWAVPTCLPLFVSRVVQLLLLLFLLPQLDTDFPSSFVLMDMYPFWLLLAVVRAIMGYVLTRSVGWAAPAFYSHWALYETSDGWGPAVIAFLILGQPSAGATPLPPFAVPALTALFAWLEARPWTYGTTLALVMILRVAQSHLLPLARGRGRSSEVESEEYLLPPVPSNSEPRKASSPSSSPSSVSTPWKFLLLSLVPLIPFALIPSPRLAYPSSATLDIVLLTYPRPIATDISLSILSNTLDSFLPHVSPQTSLSVFTHASSYPAFEELSRDPNYSVVTFHSDGDDHPNDTQGQYLHLAELFRWWIESRMLTDGGVQREWLMLMEDDFPICPDGGWEVVSTVMAILESDRIRGKSLRSGFIGTGGSGLIIHRSFLPLLIHILRTYSSTEHIFPSEVTRRAPDQVIQDCLLGRPYSLCARPTPSSGLGLQFSLLGQNNLERILLDPRGNVVIGSRIVLDHIGGMASTQVGKAGNSDKWRCGWRHAFEGDEQVDVVAV